MAMPSPVDAAARRRAADDRRRSSRREHGGGRRVSEIKDELGTMMNEKCAVFRDEAGLTEALEIIQRLKEEAETACIDDRGTVFNQDVLGAIELGYMLDCAECIVARRAGAQGVARRAVPPRLPRAQRRRVAQAHQPVRQRRRRRRSQLLAGDPHQVGAPGADVLTHARIHTEDPPLLAGVGRGGLLGGVHDRPRRAPLGARRDPPGQGPPGRLDRHPLLVPRRDLRLLRRAHQRQAGAGLPHPPRRGGRDGVRTARSSSSRWATCPCSRT